MENYKLGVDPQELRAYKHRHSVIPRYVLPLECQAMLFPASSSPLNDHFDRNEICVENGVPFAQAKRGAVKTIAKSDGAIRSVTCLVLRANDDLELVNFGPRGGAKTLWNFSTGV